MVFGAFLHVFRPFRWTFGASLVTEEAFVNAFGLTRFAFSIRLTARTAQLRVGQHVAVVAEGAKVVRVEHKALLLPCRRALLDRAHVMHLSGGSRAPLSLAALAQWVSREHHASQLQPMARVYHSAVVFVFSHSDMSLLFPLFSTNEANIITS